MGQLKNHLDLNTRQCKQLEIICTNELLIHPIIHFSHACSIQEDDRVIITGGHSDKTVSVYDENGWREDLPNLKEARMGHACTSFVSGGKKVCLLYLECI